MSRPAADNVGAVFPHFDGKHAHEELLTPAAMRDWRGAHGMLPGRVPESVVIVYTDGLYHRATTEEPTSSIGGHGFLSKVRTLDSTNGRVGVVGGFGLGAPVATIVLEDLIALGVRRFLSIGSAGALQPDLTPGDLVVCTRAIRDEGVSHHYARPEVPAEPDPTLTDALERAIGLAGLGSRTRRGGSWTVDAIYRETVAEARHYQAEGVQCVEMEAAALFTVAAHRGVALASAFCVADSLAAAEWEARWDHPDIATNLYALLRASVASLS